MMRKNMLNKIFFKNWTNLVNHLYYTLLDIIELEAILGRCKKKQKWLTFMITK